MHYTVEVPEEKDRKLLAIIETEKYLGEEQFTKLFDLAIHDILYGMNYRGWSFLMNIARISGWPVTAIWNDMKETIRDNQS